MHDTPLPEPHHTRHCRDQGWHVLCDGRCLAEHRTGDDHHPLALVAVDVDGVLNYTQDNIAPPGFTTHRYRGPNSIGQPVELDIHLSPEHGRWLAEIVDHGGSLAWASTWRDRAASWIAPRIGLPPTVPWIDVGSDSGAAFGWSRKFDAISRHAADRPLAWLEDTLGGKEFGWAEDRTDDGTPTLIIQTAYPLGLTRERVETVIGWLDRIGASA